MGITRHLITSWVLGVFLGLHLSVALLAFIDDIYLVLRPEFLRPPITLLSSLFHIVATSILYIPIFFVPALIIGGAIGLVIGLMLKGRLQAGSITQVEDIRRFLRIILALIWIVITLIAVFLVFPEVDRTISSISPPAWTYSFILIAVTTLVLMWIERRFMRWYTRHDGEQNLNNPEPVPN